MEFFRETKQGQGMGDTLNSSRYNPIKFILEPKRQQKKFKQNFREQVEDENEDEAEMSFY